MKGKIKACTLHFVIIPPPYLAPGGGFALSATPPWGVQNWTPEASDPWRWILVVGGGLCPPSERTRKNQWENQG